MSVDGLLEVSFVAWGNSVTLLALLITLVSGYLVVAYTAGKDMTRPQVITVNCVYLSMACFVLWGTVNMSGRAALFEDIAYGIAEGQLASLRSQAEVAIGLVIAFGACILASLKFMWDVRHPKTE